MDEFLDNGQMKDHGQSKLSARELALEHDQSHDKHDKDETFEIGF